MIRLEMDSADHSAKLLSLSKGNLITRIHEKEEIIAEQKKLIHELVYQLAEEKRQNHEIVQKLTNLSAKFEILKDNAEYEEYHQRAGKNEKRLLIRDHSIDSGLSCCDEESNQQSLNISEEPSSSVTSDEEDDGSLVGHLLVVCTICGSGVPIDVIEEHSVNCSSKIEDEPRCIEIYHKTLNKHKIDCTSNSSNKNLTNTTNNNNINNKRGSENENSINFNSTNIIYSIYGSCRHTTATVTLSNEIVISSSQTGTIFFKIICRTFMKEFDEKLLTVTRSPDDFVWYRKALKSFYPEFIIPPLTFKENVLENIREAQRFLNRVCAHDELNCNNLSQIFFTYSQIEFENYKEAYLIHPSKRLKHQKPSTDVVDEEGLIFRSQRYLSNFSSNLDNLIQCLRRAELSSSNDLHESFFAINKAETKDTFLKKVSIGVGQTLKNLERKNDSHLMIIEHLASLSDYVQSALSLLSRVQGCIDTYLYWNEEMEVLKQIKDEGLVSKFNEHEISKLCTEASNKRQIAQKELEIMGDTLSDELTKFDIQKEREVKQVLSEYAESKIDILQSHQTKWLAMKVLLDTDIDSQSRAIDYGK